MLLPYSSGCNVLWLVHCREDDAEMQRFGSSADTGTLRLVFIEGEFERTAKESRNESDNTTTALPLCENICTGCSYRMCHVHLTEDSCEHGGTTRLRAT